MSKLNVNGKATRSIIAADYGAAMPCIDDTVPPIGVPRMFCKDANRVDRKQIIDMMDMDMNMGMGMMLGMGFFGLLVIIALVLAIIALIKYLTSGPK